MLGANLFFKKLENLPRPAVMRPYGVRESISHPRYGFQTLLNTHSPAPLPTAPAVVGGNVDWTQAKVTPVTQHLHEFLNRVRPMNSIPAVGSFLRMREPNVNSIHTTY